MHCNVCQMHSIMLSVIVVIPVKSDNTKKSKTAKRKEVIDKRNKCKTDVRHGINSSIKDRRQHRPQKSRIFFCNHEKQDIKAVPDKP